MNRTRLHALALMVEEQREWIASRGGDETGYVAFYGAAGQPHAYGDGGEAIYRADRAALDTLVALAPDVNREG